MQKKVPILDVSSLKNAAWLNNSTIKQLFTALNGDGGDTEPAAATEKDIGEKDRGYKDIVRVVGGAVRNHLLNMPVADIDLATTLTPAEVIKRAEKNNIHYIPTGLEHGTITLVIDHQSFELTSLRRDIKTDGRRAVVEFGSDWLEDAKRRDFTINALYLSQDGTLHDPLGEGLEDLRHSRLRFIGESEQRIREDYLRILRFYRFAAIYDKAPYDAKALSATIKLQSGLDNLSAERINAELMKILASTHPQEVLGELYQNGILCRILASAPNIARTLKYIEIEDALNLKPNPAARLSALSVYHQGDVERLSKHLRLSKSEKRQLQLGLGGIKPSEQRPLSEQIKQLKALHYHLGKEPFLETYLSLWTSSSKLARDPELADLYQQAKNWETPQFPVQGEDMINQGIAPGIALGEALRSLEDHWLDKDMQPTKQQLLSRLNH